MVVGSLWFLPQPSKQHRPWTYLPHPRRDLVLAGFIPDWLTDLLTDWLTGYMLFPPNEKCDSNAPTYFLVVLLELKGIKESEWTRSWSVQNTSRRTSKMQNNHHCLAWPVFTFLRPLCFCLLAAMCRILKVWRCNSRAPMAQFEPRYYHRFVDDSQ